MPNKLNRKRPLIGSSKALSLGSPEAVAAHQEVQYTLFSWSSQERLFACMICTGMIVSALVKKRHAAPSYLDVLTWAGLLHLALLFFKHCPPPHHNTSKHLALFCWGLSFYQRSQRSWRRAWGWMGWCLGCAGGRLQCTRAGGALRMSF